MVYAPSAPSTFWLLPIVMSCGSWLKGHKQLKQGSSVSWPGLVLEIGWGAQISGEELLLLGIERSQFEVVSGIWSGRLLDASPSEVFQTRPSGRRPRGQTQDSLEGLHVPADLVAPQGSQGGAGECCCWEGGLEHPARPAGWMDVRMDDGW